MQSDIGYCQILIIVRYWLLSDIGYWLLSDIGYWLLVTVRYWLLVIGYWLLSLVIDIGYGLIMSNIGVAKIWRIGVKFSSIKYCY